MILINDYSLPNILEVGGFYDGANAPRETLAQAFHLALSYFINKHSGSLQTANIEEFTQDYLCILSINSKQDFMRTAFEEIGAIERDQRVLNRNSGNYISWFVYTWKKESVTKFLQEKQNTASLRENKLGELYKWLLAPPTTAG